MVDKKKSGLLPHAMTTCVEEKPDPSLLDVGAIEISET